MRARSIALVVWFFVAACGSDPSPASGEALYSEPHDDGNTFACATCHALSEPAPDGFTRPGHPIGDAARRPSFKNGAVDTLLEAVNSCRVEWMDAPAWSAGDPDWEALSDFLEGEAPSGPAPALSFEIVDPPKDLAGGDSTRGRELFNTSCIVCHGEDAVGTERAPPLVGELLDADYIARRVRTSGRADNPLYPGLTGGRMPFWSADRLSDDELRDIVAFVLENDPRGGGGGGGGGTLRDCDSTDPKIGQVAELTTRFHGVSGTASIVDDCTIEISNFHYDGQGIDVRFYGGLGGDFTGGLSMSEDLRSGTGYSGETVYAQLPEGHTLDEIDGISVWCVAVGVSFGDGQFASP